MGKLEFPTLLEVAPPSGSAGPTWRAKYSPEDPGLDGITNLQELFLKSAVDFANRPCLGCRRPIGGKAGPFEFLSYKEVADLSAAAHAGFEALGLKPSDKIGVIGQNCIEWMIALQGINRLNGTCVPLYDTLGDAAVEYVITHSGLKLIVAQASKLAGMVKGLSGKAKGGLSGGVIYWGEAPAETIKAIEGLGLKVFKWEEFLEKGRAQPIEPEKVTPEDLCTIMYTSGTTGDPKGVMLSHRAVVATIAGAQAFLREVKRGLGSEDVFLSYLTLAHILDRVVEEFMLHVGGSIGYFQGDIRKLMDDIDALKPTVFAGVPRVFERIYDGVMDKVEKGGFLKKLVFKYAYWRKKWYLEGGWNYEVASWISDALVFNKIKHKLGGRVRVILTGGAPISPQVEDFLRISMCAPVVQGYGLTETCAASFISFPFDIAQAGTVGPPMPHTELRLEAVPEMGYDPLDYVPRGEVCIRSKGVFEGYYKNKELTNEALDENGFFHTGDIGEITVTGALKIIDRKKNLFKLSHGEYIAVERLENEYKSNPVVEQLFLYGNSFESCLVAVVVPKEEQLREAADSAKVEGAKDRPFKELLTDPAVVEAVLLSLRATGKAAKMKGFEDIKALLLEEEQFSVDNDLMTPSFKPKRPQLQKKYQKAIDAMYDKLKKGSH